MSGPTRISSRQNATVKLLRSLGEPAVRREEGAFLLEGVHLLEEALKAGWPLRLVAYDDSAARRGAVLDALPCSKVLLENDLLVYASTSQTSPAVLAVAEARSFSAERILESAEPVLLLDGVSDPGNVGTLIRTALAAGFGGVVLHGAVADPWSPKAVRSSAGAILHLPVGRIEQIPASRLLLAASAHRGEDYASPAMDSVYRTALTLAVGSEAHGLSDAVNGAVSHFIRIPMDPRVESLNAAIAGAVVMFRIRLVRASGGT